jgi:glycosyltransferase involved in cell wall biosynthesis
VLDAVDHAALPQLYRAAAVAVVPSVWQEPFGMPIVEAMACGTPVVASRVGGIPEILGDQRGGLLVPPDDPAALAAALAGLLEDPRRRAAMGAAARDLAVTRFGWQRIAADLLAYYRELRPPRGSARGEDGGE